MSYGWLTPRPEIPRDESWFGMYLKSSLETRWEEFTFARDALLSHGGGWGAWLALSRVPGRPEYNSDLAQRMRAGAEPEAGLRLLDAGCGFEPGVHIMPEIAASIGWEVEGIDTLNAPGPTHLWEANAPHPKIRRRLLDMRATDYPDASFDAFLSISVLEHVSAEDRDATFAEARRLLKPGGLLVVTMDGLPPILVPGFEFGYRVIPKVKLCNDIGWPVSFMVGTKCT